MAQFPMAEEKQLKPNSLFHRIWIDGICKIHFEMVSGETFSIVSPSEVGLFGCLNFMLISNP